MSPSRPPSSWLHRYAIFVVAWTVVLVWWGAAVTTENVGLAVPDWPLAFNRINPDGWWRHLAILLEHGHRWLATILTALVLGLFAWVTARARDGRSPRPALALTFGELAGVVVISIALVAAIGFNQSPRVLPETAVVAGWMAAVLGALCVGWLGWSLAVRRWPSPLRLMAVIWVVIGMQAILGGLRVTRLSDGLGIFHGCLGQVLFCLLLTVALMTGPRWPTPGAMAEAVRRRFQFLGGVFLAAVAMQLVLGASIRHTQRSIPAALDVLTTGGSVWPGMADGALLLLFSHKTWALIVLALGAVLAWQAGRHLGDHRSLRRLAMAIPGLLAVQIALGVSVLLTMDRFKLPPNTTLTQLRLSPIFWVTNFHVLTGLATLACAFVFFLKVMAAVPHRGMLATGGESGPRA